MRLCEDAKSGMMRFMLLCVQVTKCVPDESYVLAEGFNLNEAVSLMGHFAKLPAV